MDDKPALFHSHSLHLSFSFLVNEHLHLHLKVETRACQLKKIGLNVFCAYKY